MDRKLIQMVTMLLMVGVLSGCAFYGGDGGYGYYGDSYYGKPHGSYHDYRGYPQRDHHDYRPGWRGHYKGH